MIAHQQRTCTHNTSRCAAHGAGNSGSAVATPDGATRYAPSTFAAAARRWQTLATAVPQNAVPPASHQNNKKNPLRHTSSNSSSAHTTMYHPHVARTRGRKRAARQAEPSAVLLVATSAGTPLWRPTSVLLPKQNQYRCLLCWFLFCRVCFPGFLSELTIVGECFCQSLSVLQRYSPALVRPMANSKHAHARHEYQHGRVQP